MSIISLCGVAVVSACVISAIRRLTPELASVSAAVAGVILLAIVIELTAPFIEFTSEIAVSVGAESYFSVMLKALAISFCCRMSAEICRDCGEDMLASRVELAGKAGIVLLSLPIISQLFDIAKDMLG